MDYTATKFWIDILVLIVVAGNAIYTWYSNREKVTNTRFKKLEEAVATRLSKTELDEAKKMFEGEEISCDHCGWHGKVSKMRLRQIVPFNWIYSPAT